MVENLYAIMMMRNIYQELFKVLYLKKFKNVNVGRHYYKEYYTEYAQL